MSERLIDRIRAVADWERDNPAVAAAWNGALAEKRVRERAGHLAQFITAQEARTPDFLRSCGLLDQELEALTQKKLYDWPAMKAVGRFMMATGRDKKTFLVLAGDVGSGKTTAACSYFLFAGKATYRHPDLGDVWEWYDRSCQYALVPEIATGPLFGAEGQAVLNRLKSCRVLVLDEFGREFGKDGRPTEVWARALFEIVDSRYRTRLPTILCTNLRRTDDERKGTEGFFTIYGAAVARRLKESGMGPRLEPEQEDRRVAG